MIPSSSGSTSPGIPPWELTELSDGRIFGDVLYESEQRPLEWERPKPPEGVWYTEREGRWGRVSSFVLPGPPALWLGIEMRMLDALRATGVDVTGSETVTGGVARGHHYFVDKITLVGGSILRFPPGSRLVTMELAPNADPMVHRRAKGTLLELFEAVARGGSPAV